MTYSFPTYIPLLVACGAVLCAIIGTVLSVRRAARAASIVFFLLAALAGGIFAPSMARDRIVLDGTHIEQVTGLWFDQKTTTFQLDAVASVVVTTARDRKNRSYEAWIIGFKDGSTQEFDPGDLWVMNGRDIALRLSEHGISVSHPGI